MIEGVEDYAILFLDTTGTILSWNKGVKMIKGYERQEIIGQSIAIFYMPQDREAKLPERLLALTRKEGKTNFVGQRIRKNGTPLLCNISLTAIFNEDRSLAGYTKIVRELDLPEIKHPRLAG
jgi:PAS domain S-box-containing protein